MTGLTDLDLDCVYVIEEMDRFRDEPSGYYKIGRSAEVAGRLKQHQTANPRELRLVEEIPAANVSFVETTMHRLLSTRRFNGEWFILRPADLTLVLAATRKLAAQQPLWLRVQQTAADLGRVPSEGDKLKPDEESTGWWERYSKADRLLKAIFELTGNLEREVLSVAKSNADHVLKLGSQPKPSLDKGRLNREHPDLYAKYLEEVLGNGGVARFARPTQVDARGSGGIERALANAEEVIRKLRSGVESVERAHEAFLLLEEYRSLEELEKDICRANLQNLSGVAPGIEGIMTWNRVPKLKPKFRTEDFKADYKEWAQQFPTTTPNVSMKLRPNRKYLFSIPAEASDLQPLRALTTM